MPPGLLLSSAPAEYSGAALSAVEPLPPMPVAAAEAADDSSLVCCRSATTSSFARARSEEKSVALPWGNALRRVSAWTDKIRRPDPAFILRE